MTKFVPPSQGGSYRVGKDGKPVRAEFTTQLSDPAHPARNAPAAPPATSAPAQKGD